MTSSRLGQWRAPVGAFAVALVIYGAVAGPRLRHRSPDPHFIFEAYAWLHGHLDIAEWPLGADDPAKLEEVELKDGRVVRGRRLATRPTFQVAGGKEIPVADVGKTLGTIQFNAFPPLPTVIMLPFVAVQGVWVNDVLITVIAAAFIPFFFLLFLRRLRGAGLSARSEVEDLWLTGLLCFGTVLFFSSVQGRVWYTAHVFGVLCATLFLWATVEARRPLLAGLFLGCAFATRTPMLFLGVLYLWEHLRTKQRLSRLLVFAAPVVVIGLACAAYNLARFHDPFEFGHRYLAIKQQNLIEAHGLASPYYLQRNLSVIFTLLPDFSRHAPYVSLSGHGLALWVTTPALVLLLWPRERGPWHLALWVTVACVAAPGLLYHNDGWLQFGYRFGLDFMALLVALLAVGGRRIGRGTQALILIGVLVNLFGAVTFNRMPQFYGKSTFECVVPN